MIADLDRFVVPGLSLWQHPRFFGYFPANALQRGHSRRSRLDRPRRDRAFLAIEPGGDGDRGGRHRLAPADAGALARLLGRDPGHRLDQHAGRAHLRARAGDELRAGARRPAGRKAHAARLCVGACAQFRRQGRAARRLRPRQSAARAVRREYAMRRRRAWRDDRRGSRQRRPALRDRRHRRHDRDDGRSIRSRRSPRSRGATASGCMSTPPWRAAR